MRMRKRRKRCLREWVWTDSDDMKKKNRIPDELWGDKRNVRNGKNGMAAVMPLFFRSGKLFSPLKHL